MKKRIFSLGILLILMCFILTGCGNKSEETSTNESNKNTQNNSTSIDTEIKTNNNTTTQDKTSVDDVDIVELYSDDSKLVFKSADTVYMVFTYSGDKITGYSTYADCGSVSGANAALIEYNKNPDEEVKRVYTKGQYFVAEFKESEYVGLSVSEIRQAMSYLQEIKK